MSAHAAVTAERPGLALSPRQYEVAVLLRAGLSRPQVARELGVEANTVKTVTTVVYRALGIQTREELGRVSFSSWPQRSCALCGGAYTPVRRAQRFCSGCSLRAHQGRRTGEDRP